MNRSTRPITHRCRGTTFGILLLEEWPDSTWRVIRITAEGRRNVASVFCADLAETVYNAVRHSGPT